MKIKTPCPFCKDTIPLVVKTVDCSCNSHKWSYVECEACGATGPKVYIENNASEEKIKEVEEAAVNWWDTGNVDSKILADYDEALRLMVWQYCTMKDNGKQIFHNRCMTAGEHAFKVLNIENGQSAEEFIEELMNE